MLEGLLADSGIPPYEKFCARLNSLKEIQKKEKGGKKRNNKVFIDEKIAYLPQKGTAFFIGDLHGDFEALVSIVKQARFFEAMKAGEKVFLVFLGDYGDRGKKIIETIYGILTLKTSYPKNVILLKGNHEELEMAEYYGTYEIFLQTYGGEKGEFLFNLYCDVMSGLPVTAVATDRIIGVHAGIPNQDIKSLDILNTSQGVSYVKEMIWNDPNPSIPERGFNSRGGSTTTFGEKAFQRFMEIAPASLMVRSHQYSLAGVELLFSDRLATIFSNGSERGQSSAYSHNVRRPVFLKVNLSEKKERFQDSDFIEVLY